jgi:hypothetical protein
MPGTMVSTAPFTYSDTDHASMKKYPSDTYNLQLAALAAASGLTHVLDPAFYDPATGVALDLETAGTFTSANKVPVQAAAQNGQPLFNFAAGASNLGFDASFAKTEASFSFLAFISQVAADQSAAGYKTLFAYGTNSTSYIFAETPSSAVWSLFNAGGQAYPSVTISPAARVLLVSYDSPNKQVQFRDTNDTVISTGTLLTDPLVGNPWRIGGFGNAVGFQGKIGKAVIFNKALHLPANDVVRQSLQALFRAQYGL